MYKQNIMNDTSLKTNEAVEGERLETKIERMSTGGEPITDKAEMIYTERNEGVQPAYNIRTDKMEIAMNAMDIAAKTTTAKRNQREHTRKIRENEPLEGETPKDSGTSNNQ